MKVLIIEDDQNKLKQIKDYLYENFNSIDICEKYSWKSGLEKIMEQNSDLVLLDMSLPTFEKTISEMGGTTEAFAGKIILSRMKRLKITIPTIIVTQFTTFGDEGKKLEMLMDELEGLNFSNYRGTIFYTPKHNNWKIELESKISQVIGENK